MLIALISTLAFAEDVWLVREVELLRWPDHAEGREVIVAEGDAGDKVEVLVRDAELVRVRMGGDFGWVPADAISEEAPEEASPAAP